MAPDDPKRKSPSPLGDSRAWLANHSGDTRNGVIAVVPKGSDRHIVWPAVGVPNTMTTVVQAGQVYRQLSVLRCTTN